MRSSYVNLENSHSGVTTGETHRAVAHSKLFLSLKAISSGFLSLIRKTISLMGGHLVVVHMLMRERQTEKAVSRCFVARSRWHRRWPHTNPAGPEWL
jgi:hypothetical protein